MNPVILIPCRMASTRLPGKPLADIAGKPMIIQVLNRALEADIGPAFVATDDDSIYDIVKASSGEAVMTNKQHTNGSDRIFEALNLIDKAGQFDTIINVQGDLPTVDRKTIRTACHLLEDNQVDISTVAAQINDESEKHNPNVVKVVGTPLSNEHLRALYFTRATVPYGSGPLYHHIGLYGYRRQALERYVSLAPSYLEKRENLEQLRALEAGMRIEVGLVKEVPLGVDTPNDLERARAMLS